MGVDVSAEVMVGIWFDDTNEAKEFILNNFDLSEDVSGMCIGEISEYLESEFGLVATDYSEYHDRGGCCLGITLGESDIEPTGKKVAAAYEFVKYRLECHDGIQTHIWVRYR